jgi:hypothetical protein
VRAKTLNQINDDCVRLSIVKKDGSPNRNAYLCLLIRNFFPYVRDKKVSLKVDRLFDDENVSENTIYIEPDKLSADDFLSFYSFSKKDSYGSALRALVEKFFTLESDERERIILTDTYDRIERAIKGKSELTVRTYDRFRNKAFQYPFDPYVIARTPDRIFNYVIGKMYRNDDGAIVSVRLSKIDGLSFRGEKWKQSESDKEAVAEIIKNGPQFSETGTFDAKVVFTEEGLVKLRLAYKNRPLIVLENGNEITFRTSTYGAMLYFPQFGDTAIVAAPEELRSKLLDFHKSAFEAMNDRQ